MSTNPMPASGILRMGLIFLMAVGLMTVNCGPRGQDETAQEKTSVQAVRPQRMDVEDVLRFIGELRAKREARLEFNLSGRIATLGYEVGDRVEKGMVMATVSQEEIRAHLEQAQAAHTKAQADLQRIERLHEERIVSDDRLEAARVGAKQANAAYVMADEAMKNSSVIAPFAGSVAEKNGEVGEYYNAMMGGPPVYRLVKIDSVKVIIGVPEAEVPRVKKEQQARILLDTYPDEVFLGQVTRTGLVIDRFSRTMEVEITVSNDRRLLKPGMMVDIELVIDQRQGVLSVPLKAIIRDMGLEHVFVVEDERSVVREVTTGVEQDGRVEVVAGLNGVEQVVVEGQFGLKEGDPVSIASEITSGQDQ
jgi:membrane fusion protein (multidrug efflux system)